jgi:hypothetical protein
MITYRGFEIKEDTRNPYASIGEEEYKYFPEGNESDDADYDYESASYHYTGNGKWVDSIEEAKAAIDDFYLENTSYRVIREIPRVGPTITKFDFISEALAFASKVNGELVMLVKGKEVELTLI